MDSAKYIGKFQQQNKQEMNNILKVRGKAEDVLRRRALSCSFSSVFHLKKAGLSDKDFAKVIRLFKVGIILPMGLLTAGVVIKKSELGYK
mmetsp:Transcript_40518/g.53335  ORF Transcript_40518/g.53335 Transcript_40518/m.53335 type:complete len:90 (-) Transcript_40518:176-445(-)